MSIVMLWNIRCSSRIFSVIYSWLIRKKTETIQNKYEMERDYIKSNNEKKKKKSIFCFKFNNNRTFIPTVSRIFQNGMRTFSLSLSFCICITFIFVANLLFFRPALYAFFVSIRSRPILLVALSFLSPRVPFVWYDFYSRIRVEPIWEEKKFDGFKIRFGQKSAVSRLSELAFIFARFALFHRLCFQLPPFFPVSFFFL